MGCLTIKRLAAIWAATFMLVACGGGGSDDEVGDTPPPDVVQDEPVQAATLDEQTSREFAEDVLRAVRVVLGSSFGGRLSVQSSTADGFVAREHGCHHGAVDLQLDRDGTGNFSGTAAFDEFDNCVFFEVDGVAPVSGTMSGDRIGTVVYTLDRLTWQPDESSASFRLTGRLTLTWHPSVQGSASYTAILDAAVFDSSGQEIARYESLQIDSQIVAGFELVRPAGRVHHPGHGYVDLRTPVQFRFHVPGDAFWDGQFMLDGAANKTATLDYRSGNVSIAIE